MKFDSIRAARGYWIFGFTLAIAGVLLARTVAPRYSDKIGPRIKIAGQITSFAGLGIICIGVSRRITKESEKNS